MRGLSKVKGGKEGTVETFMLIGRGLADVHLMPLALVARDKGGGGLENRGTGEQGKVQTSGKRGAQLPVQLSGGKRPRG